MILRKSLCEIIHLCSFRYLQTSLYKSKISDHCSSTQSKCLSFLWKVAKQFITRQLRCILYIFIVHYLNRTLNVFAPPRPPRNFSVQNFCFGRNFKNFSYSHNWDWGLVFLFFNSTVIRLYNEK